MNQPTSPSSLDARIRAARQGVRSGQPLAYRVELARKRHVATKQSSSAIHPARPLNNR